MQQDDSSEPWIALISEEEAERRRPTGHAYNPGTVPTMGRLLWTHPRIGPAYDALQTEIMFADGHLDRREREFLAVVTSAAQDCFYQTQSHGEFLRVEGEDEQVVQAVMQHRWRELQSLTSRQRALGELAEKMTLNPTRMVRADWVPLRELGFDDVACLEVAHVIALFNYVTRLADAFGIQPDPETKH